MPGGVPPQDDVEAAAEDPCRVMKNRGPNLLVARGQYGASSLYGITHWSRYTTPLTTPPRRRY